MNSGNKRLFLRQSTTGAPPQIYISYSTRLETTIENTLTNSVPGSGARLRATAPFLQCAEEGPVQGRKCFLSAIAERLLNVSGNLLDDIGL